MRREGQPIHVESINSYTTVLYMVLGLASLYQCTDCGAPINQSMSDDVSAKHENTIKYVRMCYEHADSR